MTNFQTIHVKRILKQAQEKIDHLLENLPDPATHCRLSQADIHIHEALIILSEDSLFQGSESVNSNGYLDNVVPLPIAEKPKNKKIING